MISPMRAPVAIRRSTGRARDAARRIAKAGNGVTDEAEPAINRQAPCLVDERAAGEVFDPFAARQWILSATSSYHGRFGWRTRPARASSCRRSTISIVRARDPLEHEAHHASLTTSGARGWSGEKSLPSRPFFTARRQSSLTPSPGLPCGALFLRDPEAAAERDAIAALVGLAFLEHAAI
jgi:hypothetical protein